MIFRRFFLLAFLLLSASLWALPQQRFVRALRDLPLYAGPGKSYGEVERGLRGGEVAYWLGVSLNGSWSKVLTSNGVEAWTPTEFVSEYEGSPPNYDDFDHHFAARRAIGTWFSLQLGPAWGSHPVDFRGQADILFNFTPNGLVDVYYDQLELGLGGAYHPYAPPFGEAHVFFQWLYRFGSRRNSMLGPRFGYAIMEDPTYRFDYANFFMMGLAFRHYLSDHFGFYVEGNAYARSRLYGSASGGLSLRF
jgi:hypothetical protein